jgi:GT2 family glycosyltransferase
MKDDITATVLVVTYERLQLTKRCLDAVLANTNTPFNLIIVDNNSRADVRSCIMRYPGTKVLLDANVGFYRALNIGMKIASSELIAILDCDIVVPIGWWQALSSEVAATTDAGLAGARYTNSDGTLQEGYPRLSSDGWYGTNKEEVLHPADCQYIAIGCSVLRRSAWQKVGGFDESYFISHGDIDFCYKLRYEGDYRIRYCPECSAIHDRDEAREDAYESIRFDTNTCDADFNRFRRKWVPRYKHEGEYACGDRSPSNTGAELGSVPIEH